MTGDPYHDLSSVKSGGEEKLRRFLGEFAPYLVLIFNIGVEVVLQLFVVGLTNPFSPSFFVKLFANVTATLFCYAFFVPYGNKTEKAGMLGYAENCNRWTALSRSVRDNALEDFREFCRTQIEREREEKRRAIIENGTMIGWATYNSVYRAMPASKVQALVEASHLSKAEAKAINRANSKIRVRPINPLLVLCGVKASHINDAGRTAPNYTVLSIVSRPVAMFITSAVFTAISATYSGLTEGNSVLSIVLTSLSIILASVLGYFNGAGNAKKEHEDIKNRILFLEEFVNQHKERGADKTAPISF